MYKDKKKKNIIVTRLLHANCKENLTTRIFANKQIQLFKGLIIFISVAMATAHTPA